MDANFSLHVRVPTLVPTRAAIGAQDCFLTRGPLGGEAGKAKKTDLPQDVLSVIGGSPLVRLTAAAAAQGAGAPGSSLVTSAAADGKESSHLIK